jgi:hypothetical protein
MSAFKAVKGHCQCGAVGFRITAPPEKVYHCHCSMCRRLHGSMFGTYGLIARDALVLERGADSMTRFQSSAPFTRLFCRTCGCQMFVEEKGRADIILFMPGTCDWPSAEPPAPNMDHCYVGSKVPWYRIGDGLPQREEG